MKKPTNTFDRLDIFGLYIKYLNLGHIWPILTPPWIKVKAQADGHDYTKIRNYCQ